MAHFEEAKGGWPPHDALSHLATHTPIQVGRPGEATQGAYRAMQPGTWRLPVPAHQYSNFGKTPNHALFGPEWQSQSEWTANNNKLGEWEKWSGTAEVAQPPIPSFGNNSITAMMNSMPNAEYTSPKEEERKSTEHTDSYDVSASQSPKEDENAEEPIDIECTAPTDKEEVSKEEPSKKCEEESDKVDVSTPSKEEASNLLLNFCNQSKFSTFEEPKSLGFLHSGSSAFSEPTGTPILPSNEGKELTTASFCRPPGLGPVTMPPPTNGQAAPLVCPICGFSCNSKFHYNSHMNTHGDHQCNMCDYTSRTEGRLKKHMRESHTVEEQLKAGMDVEAPTTPSTPTSTQPPASPLKMETVAASTLSTTMASLLNSTSLVSGINTNSDITKTPKSIFSMDVSANSSILDSLPPTSMIPSALDQIRAFTEKSSLLPEGGLNLAHALGAVSQAITGEPKTPEKQSNSEPRRNSNGKVKILKCKQCGHQSMSKDEQWAHARTHIPSEKQLNCQHCNFVTEYKHHLEYHYRNHIGSKPFQCKKCAYTCVNKSMLNSHMKSHTNHYQFRCMDCTYATKYCHSLKLHLKKYNHRRVSEDSDINDSLSSSLQSELNRFSAFAALKIDPSPPSTSLAQSLGLTPMMNNQNLNFAGQALLRQHQLEHPMNPLLGLGALGAPSFPPPSLKCPMCDLQCATPEEQIRHNMNHLLANTPTSLATLYSGLTQLPTIMSEVARPDVDATMDVDETQQESQDNGDDNMDGVDQSSMCADSPTGSSKASTGSLTVDDEVHKKKVFNLEQISQRLQGKSPSNTESSEDKEESNVESSMSPLERTIKTSPPATPAPMMSSLGDVALPSESILPRASEPSGFNNFFQQAACMAFNALQSKRDVEMWKLQCHHCRMAFQDQSLYTIHMSYHAYENVFKCNRCGHTSHDSLSFNLHLLQSSHQ